MLVSWTFVLILFQLKFQRSLCFNIDENNAAAAAAQSTPIAHQLDTRNVRFMPTISTTTTKNASFTNSVIVLSSPSHPLALARSSQPRLIQNSLAGSASGFVEYDQADSIEKYLKSLEKHGSRLRPSSSVVVSHPNVVLEAASFRSDQFVFIEFDAQVSRLVGFEPKTGYIELELQLVYKWWRSRDESTDVSDLVARVASPRSNNNRQASVFYPATKFRDKSSRMFIDNQLHTIGNIQTVNESLNAIMLEQMQFDNTQLLEKLDRFKAPGGGSRQRPSRTIYRQYSKLEQNVTARFKCKQTAALDDNGGDYSSGSGLDMSRFPFDSHACELDLELVPIIESALKSSNKTSPNNNEHEQQQQRPPVFIFLPTRSSTLTATTPRRIFINTEINNSSTTSFVDLYLYNNKLVHTSNNYSLIGREWLLKKVAVFYANATTPPQLHSLTSATTQADKFDHILALNRLTNDSALTSLILSNQQHQQQQQSQTQQQQRATITMRFVVYRRREPQVYVFVLPVLLFTSITFLIFFLPTTTSSEKSLIAFLNFASLLAYNLYLFKLIIYEYEFQRIPLLLQYSNCLMVIQLGVLAYTCLVKSIYHQGFLTFGPTRASFASLAEHAYRQIAVLNYQELNEQRKRDKQLVRFINSCNNNSNHNNNQSNPQLADCMTMCHAVQHSSEPPIYGSVEEETAMTHLCDKVEVII